MLCVLCDAKNRRVVADYVYKGSTLCSNHFDILVASEQGRKK